VSRRAIPSGWPKSAGAPAAAGCDAGEDSAEPRVACIRRILNPPARPAARSPSRDRQRADGDARWAEGARIDGLRGVGRSMLTVGARPALSRWEGDFAIGMAKACPAPSRPFSEWPTIRPEARVGITFPRGTANTADVATVHR
jgi:hypothetical protein